MDIKQFLSESSFWNTMPKNDFPKHTIGASVMRYGQDEAVFSDFKIAILGVADNRAAYEINSFDKSADKVRSALYLLSNPFKLEIIDLGNIIAGHDFNDTLFALRVSCFELIKSGVVPIIIGGSQALTYGQYQAYETLEQSTDVAILDAKMDIQQTENDNISNNNYIYNILAHQPNYLFNLMLLGYQSYFVDPSYLHLFEKFAFDGIRLGLLKSDLEAAEPLIRTADMVSVDLNVIKASDARVADSSPNGLFGDEASQLVRYAGLNDKLTSIGFYNYDPLLDPDGLTAALVAQLIWCFIEGVDQRCNDFPTQTGVHFTKFTTLQKGELEVVFWKSNKTGRWWIEVPSGKYHPKYHRNYLVPCTYQDYKTASNNDLPDVWIKAHVRFSHNS